MKIILERIYDASRQAGYRVLVDRLWSRGITKQEAALDEWCKVLAPSTELGKWFGHDSGRWAEFQMRYLRELDGQKGEALALLARAGQKNLILLYMARRTARIHTRSCWSGIFRGCPEFRLFNSA